MDRDRSFSPTWGREGDRWTEAVALAQQGGDKGRQMDRDRSFSPTGRTGGDRWTETVALAQQEGEGETDGQRS